MNLPTALTIASHPYRVVVIEDLRNAAGEGCWGTCDRTKLEIELDADLGTMPTKALETLLHETLEALDAHLALNLDHDTIRRLANGLMGALANNPELLGVIEAAGRQAPS